MDLDSWPERLNHKYGIDRQKLSSAGAVAGSSLQHDKG